MYEAKVLQISYLHFNIYLIIHPPVSTPLQKSNFLIYQPPQLTYSSTSIQIFKYLLLVVTLFWKHILGNAIIPN